MARIVSGSFGSALTASLSINLRVPSDLYSPRRASSCRSSSRPMRRSAASMERRAVAADCLEPAVHALKFSEDGAIPRAAAGASAAGDHRRTTALASVRFCPGVEPFVKPIRQCAATRGLAWFVDRHIWLRHDGGTLTAAIPVKVEDRRFRLLPAAPRLGACVHLSRTLSNDDASVS